MEWNELTLTVCGRLLICSGQKESINGPILDHLLTKTEKIMVCWLSKVLYFCNTRWALYIVKCRGIILIYLFIYLRSTVQFQYLWLENGQKTEKDIIASKVLYVFSRCSCKILTVNFPLFSSAPVEEIWRATLKCTKTPSSHIFHN